MKNATATEIKHIESNFTPLDKFGTEVNSDTVFWKECELEAEGYHLYFS